MFNSDNGYSLADIAAVTNGGYGYGRGTNVFSGYGGNGWGFGGDGSWLILLFILFAFGGWGNGGFGGWGNGFGGLGTTNIWQNGALTRGELCQDMNFMSLDNNVEAVKTGVNDALFTLNTNLLQGFDGIAASNATNTAALQNTLTQGFANITLNDVRNADALQLQLSNQALTQQQCCCDVQNTINTQANALNYNLATEECATRTAMASGLRDVIDATNNNTKQILDFLVQDKLSTLQNENQSLRLAASQAQQNAALGAMMAANTQEILDRAAPIPVPAYPASNLYGYYNCNTCGCGNNNTFF